MQAHLTHRPFAGLAIDWQRDHLAAIAKIAAATARLRAEQAGARDGGLDKQNPPEVSASEGFTTCTPLPREARRGRSDKSA